MATAGTIISADADADDVAKKQKPWWLKLNFIKKCTAAGCGIAILIISILTLLNFLDWFTGPLLFFNLVRTLWNILFGALIVFLQLSCDWLFRNRFGFLGGCFGRGSFYLFVGTNVIPPPKHSGDWAPWWTYVVGGTTIAVGVLELILGCTAEKVEPKPAAAAAAPEPSAAGRSTGGGFFGVFGSSKAAESGRGTSSEPTFTVNFTQSQAIAAAGAAASAATAVGAAAASSGKTASDNPFMGNSHLTHQASHGKL